MGDRGGRGGDPPERVDHLNAPADAPVSRPRPAVLPLERASKIRACHRVGGRHGVLPERSLTHQVEEHASLRRCRVSLFLQASFTIERQVEHDLIPVGEEIVQTIDLGSGVRERPASAHHG